jgi:hypothetical protein
LNHHEIDQRIEAGNAHELWSRLLGGRRLSLAGCVTVTGATGGATAAGGRSCRLSSGNVCGNADADDACVAVSEMEKVTRVLAVTAVDVCRRSRPSSRS